MSVRTSRNNRSLCHSLAAALVAILVAAPAVTLSASAQQAVVQPLPDPATGDLSGALQRLAASPQSVAALVDAGNASITLGDLDAAEGFFSRAASFAPGDGRVLAGQARLALARHDAVSALHLFDRASVAGQSLDDYAADRGLAYDLVGMNSRAQVLYGRVLAKGEDAEIIRRLALSYAIAGDEAASEATLLPLLQARDLAAYRTRAFALAIVNRPDEAASIADTMLPPRIAQRLAPYLRYMPQLTRAQQAAAANFGTFPHPAEIGRDPPDIAAFAAAEPPAAGAATGAARGAGSRLIPGGEPLGPVLAQATPSAGPPPAGGELPSVSQQNTASPAATRNGVSAATPPPELPPAMPDAAFPAAGAGGATPQAAPPVASASSPEAPRTAAPALQAQSVPVAAPQGSSSPQSPPAAAPPPDRAGLAEAFSEFQRVKQQPLGPSSVDAVDITRIMPPRDAPLEQEPPVLRLPVNPGRHWVQVATGQDVANFKWDWRRIVTDSQGLLDGQNGYFAPWGSNNRLITGPFASEEEAQALVSKLAAKGVPSFVFDSGTGERVIPLP